MGDFLGAKGWRAVNLVENRADCQRTFSRFTNESIEAYLTPYTGNKYF